MQDIGPIDWLAMSGIKGYKRIYCHSIDTDTIDGGLTVYCVMGVINKNKSPERHEILVFCAQNARVLLVERLVDAQGKKNPDGTPKGEWLAGHVGDVTLKVLPGDVLDFTATIDLDPTERYAMFPPQGFIRDGTKRRDPQTYKV
jgi:hypothetical protein